MLRTFQMPLVHLQNSANSVDLDQRTSAPENKTYHDLQC